MGFATDRHRQHTLSGTSPMSCVKRDRDSTSNMSNMSILPVLAEDLAIGPYVLLADN
jgi:hypothetical protein